MMPLPKLDVRYTNIRPIGQGGFGEVYRAYDTRMGRDVAIKLLAPRFASLPKWQKRFRQEATVVSKFFHPNITGVLDRSDDESQPYIVMEFVEGEPLSKIIERRD